MNPTRRNFLQQTTLLAAIPLLGVKTASAQAAPILPRPPGPRRGLLFDESDLPRIRANTTDPRFAPLWASMLAADLVDDTDFLTHHVRFNHHGDDMLRVRTILERAAFIYAVTRDSRQLTLAKLAKDKLLAYPKWDMFLEGGRTVFGLQRAPEAVIALAFTLDWLGDALTEKEQADIERQIADKGAPACFTTLYGMKYPDRVRGWTIDQEEDYAFKQTNLARWPLILNSTNLKMIPIAALGIAGCLFSGRHPQADAWLDLARWSAKEFGGNYGSDGSYGEGPSYWNYTTMHLALLTEVLWRTRGIDDSQVINFPGTISNYGLALTLPRLGTLANPNEKQENMGVPLSLIPPQYDIVNFGDANGSFEISVAAWVARKFMDPVAQTVAHDIGEAKYHYAFIWYDPAIQLTPPPTSLLNDRMLNDLVVSRSGWQAKDSVVAFRSGGPGNHEHADRNSIIFKAHGDRLFNDPFRAGYSYTLERWKLRLTSAHTAILVDGKGHIYHNGHEGTNASTAFAQVTSFKTGPNWMIVTSDATDAYQQANANVGRVDRTLVYLKPDVLLVLDRVDLKLTAATVEARFQVYNDDQRGTCSGSGQTFRIVRPFATLQARAVATNDFETGTGKLNLAPKEGLFPYATVMTVAANTHAILTACTAAPAGEPHGALAIDLTGNGWRVHGTHRGQTVDVTVNPAGEGPPAISV